MAGGAGAAFGGVADIGLGLMAQNDARRAASRADATQREAFDIAFSPEQRAVRDLVTGGFRDSIQQELGGFERGAALIDEDLQNIIADTPELQRQQQQLDQRKADLEALRLRRFEMQGNNNRALEQQTDAQIKRDEASIAQDEVNLKSNVAQMGGFEFDPATGQLFNQTKIEGRQLDPTFQSDQRVAQLGEQQANQIAGQQGDLQRILQNQIQGFGNIAGDQSGALQQALQGSQGILGQAQDLTGIQNAQLSQAIGQVPQAFGQAQGLAQQFGAEPNALQQFGAEQFDPRFQTAVEGQLGQAEGMDAQIQQDTDQLISGIEEQSQREQEQAVKDAKDEMARRGLTGSGQEDAIVNDISERFARQRSTQISGLRRDAIQQQFNNRLQSQQNVSSLAQSGSGLRGARQGQGIQGAQANAQGQQNQFQFAQQGANLGAQQAQLQSQFGQQQLANLSGLGGLATGLGGFQGGMVNQLAQALQQGLGQQGSLQSQLVGLPAELTGQLSNLLGGLDARNQALSQQNFANQITNRNQLLNLTSQTNNAAAQAGTQQSAFGQQQQLFANQQGRGAANAIGQGVGSLISGISQASQGVKPTADDTFQFNQNFEKFNNTADSAFDNISFGQ